MQRLQTSKDEAEITALNQVGEAVNFAMQQRLAKADFILRGILKSGDLKVRREGGREGVVSPQGNEIRWHPPSIPPSLPPFRPSLGHGSQDAQTPQSK